ncbi:PREDICTED: protein TMED8 [Nanorana parkeri]|uniref:protein TMED8 n=1 Tax=Nanorana parkeri TaxID=125878 RepID=UPI00085412D6|nr:PREDICTED: protein TMED8 [Nanorana parkeri]
MPTILTSEVNSLGSDRLHSSISVRASLDSLVPAPYTPDAVIGWHPVLSGDCRTFPSRRSGRPESRPRSPAHCGPFTVQSNLQLFAFSHWLAVIQPRVRSADSRRIAVQRENIMFHTGETRHKSLQSTGRKRGGDWWRGNGDIGRIIWEEQSGEVHEEAMMARSEEEEEEQSGGGPDNGGTNPETDVTDPDPTQTSAENNQKPPEPPAKSSLDKEIETLLSCSSDPPPPDVLVIQSENAGMVGLVQVEQNTDDPAVTEKKAPPPPLRPPTTWTSANVREFKHRMSSEKHGMLTVRRGEVMTVRVPTHPEGKRLCWEFATEDYDIGFGIYFDWTPVTSTAVTIQVSESSDDEEEEETESPWHSREGDVERGSVYRLRSRYGEIMQVFRRDSHREVQAGSHDYPGEGVYLLKLDNSYSLLRNKTLFFHVYYSS